MVRRMLRSLMSKKPFDSVWINGMLYKLLQLGMDRRLWAIILRKTIF